MPSRANRRLRLIVLAIVTGLLIGCASFTSVAPDNNCIGTVVTPPAALRETSEPELLALAIGEPTKGALCLGKVFVAEKPVTVYRVWDASKPYTALGRWWSLSIPRGPRDQYRVENSICPEWSPLDRMSSCTLKAGSKVVIGPGQSAKCQTTLLQPSAINQVYIPNDSRNDQLFVENCSAGAAWPAAGQ